MLMTVNIPPRPALKTALPSYRQDGQDGRLEGQDESGIVVALDSLNDKVCFPSPSAARKCLFSV